MTDFPYPHPQNWEVVPFGAVHRFSKGIGITKGELVESGIGVISYGQIHAKNNLAVTINPNLIRFAPSNFDVGNVQNLQHGDLIFADTSEDFVGIGAFARFDLNDKVFPGYHTLVARPQDRFRHKYFSYLYLSDAWRNQIRQSAMGVKVYSVTQSLLKQTAVLVPPAEKQESIVRFLDAETAKIDHLIAKQRELITSLEQRKSAFAENVLINGTESGNVASANFRRVKHLFKLRDERNYQEREDVTLLSLYAKYGIRKYDEIEQRKGNPVRTVEGYKCVRRDDIVVNIILAWMGAIGRSTYEGVISPAYDIWTPQDGVSSRYYHHLFRTKWFSGECFKRGKGIMMMRWRTYADQFGDISVPFPTQEQQEHLVDLIEGEEARIEVLINKNRRMIKLLQERHSALITAAVTGQIEV